MKSLLRLLGVAVTAGLWQLLTGLHVLPSSDFPTLSATVVATLHLLGGEKLWPALWETIVGWLGGVIIGSSCAVVLGTFVGSRRILRESIMPLVELLKATPPIAILPLVLLIFGTRLQMKWTLVAFGVFWPLLIQVIYGVQSVDPNAAETSRALGLARLRHVRWITLPSAAPYIAVGLRVAAISGLVIEVIAELVGGASGLGQQVLLAENAGPSELPVMYGYVALIATVGLVLSLSLRSAERHLLSWHGSYRQARHGS